MEYRKVSQGDLVKWEVGNQVVIEYRKVSQGDLVKLEF